MILGIVSDTHGNARRTARATGEFLSRGVNAVVHCGDIGGENVLMELVAAFDPIQIPVYCVEGNVDYGDISLRSFPSNTVVMLLGAFGDLTLAGKRIAVTHGDDAVRLRAAARRNEYDYVLTGHTHQPEDRMEGQTRVINPGAVHRTPEPGIAVLDTVRDEITFLALIDRADQ